MSEAVLFPEIELDDPHLAAPPDQKQRLQAIDGDYIASFINAGEEQSLIDKINSEPWLNDLQRRVQHYGYRYHYKARKIDNKDYLGKLPAWAEFVIKRLMEQNVFKERPDQMIVNEYQPGQGIASHTDRDCFGPVLASLSLGSACVMQLKCFKKEEFDIILEPRSLVVYDGTSRKDWQHGIVARRSDKVENKIYRRKLRISLTFRTVIERAPV